MSTTTTIKRIALVAVAALGFGMLSVVPSSAAVVANTLTIDSATDSISLGETATAVLSHSFVTTSAQDSVTITAIKTSSNSATAGTIQFRPTDSSVASSTTVKPDYSYVKAAQLTGNADATGLWVASASSSGYPDSLTVSAASTNTSVNTTFGVNLVNPTAAGTYVVKFYMTVSSAGATATTSTTVAEWTVTVAAADTTAVGSSTSVIRTGAKTVADGTSSTGDSAVVASKSSTRTTQDATIYVTQKNAAGTTLADAALTVVVKSGTPGTVGSAVSTDTGNMVSSGRANSVAAGHHIGVFSDGVAGVAEVEIYAGTVLLATEKVTFFGDVASYTGTFTPKALGVLETSTITVTGKDAAGNAATVGTVYYTTSDSSVATVTSGGVVAGVKSGKATISICNTSACTAATITTTVAVQVGAKTATTVALSFSNTTPTAGEKVTVTLTATDASGNAVADGARFLLAAGGFSPSVTVSGSTVPAVETVTLSAGVASYIFYAPAAGTVTFTATEGSATDSTTKGTITGSVTVSNPGLDAATDAAIEAFDAANAATDAALSAAEAADLATQAAQEASDAVAALSETVTQLIAGLQAQIKSLAAVVAKIAKKVKA